MRILHKLFTIFLIVIAAGYFTDIYSSNKDQVSFLFGGDSNYPPYEFLDDEGQPAGFNVDLLDEISTIMGFDVDYKLDTWSETMNLIDRGQIDGLMGLAFYPERALKFRYSLPHNSLNMSIFVHKDRSKQIRGIDDLVNKEIIVQKNGIMHDFLIHHNLTESIILVDNPNDALLLLSENRHDAALLNEKQCLYLLRINNIKNIIVIDKPLLVIEYCFAQLREKGDLIHILDEGLLAVRNSGKYEELYNKWFSEYDMGKFNFLDWVAKSLYFLITLIFVFIIIFLWIYLLKTQVRKRTDQLYKELKDHRKTSAELEKNKVKYQNLVDTLPDAIFEVDLNFNIQYINQASYKIMGIESQKKIAGLKITDFLIEKEKERFLRDTECLLDGSKSIIQAEYELVNGKSRFIPVDLCMYANMVDGGIIGFNGLIMDLSKQKKSEKVQAALFKISQSLSLGEDLSTFYEKIHNIIKELMPAENFCIALIDKEKKLINYPYNIDIMNECSVCNKFGNTLVDLVFQENRSLVLKNEDFHKLIENRKLSLTGIHPKVWIGIPLRINNEILGIMSLRDYVDENIYGDEEKRILNFVSEQVASLIEKKKSQEELNEYLNKLEDLIKKRTEELTNSKESFRTLSENSKEVIMRFDKEHKHLYVNPIIEEQTGMPPDMFIGKSHKELGFPEDLVEVWDKAIDIVFNTKEPYNTEFMLPNGVWIDWHLVPEFSENNDIVSSVLATSYDITKRKEYEEKIKNLNDDLENRVKERTKQLQEEISIRKESELIQKIQLEISELVTITQNSEHLYKEIHRVIKQLIPAENIYITLYHKEENLLSFPYFVDEFDITPEPQKPGRGLTEYVLKSGEGLLVKLNDAKNMAEQGKIDLIGEFSKVWLGVPLKIKDKTVGVIALQDYYNEDTYDHRDKMLLTFVSEQIALTLERKEILEEINLQKSYFEQLYESIPIGIAFLDNNDVIQRVNKAFTNIFEYKPEEVLNNPINSLIVDSDHTSEAENLSAGTREGKIIFKETIRFTKTGKPVFVRIYGVPLIIRTKQIGIYGIYEDISQRMEAEIKLKQSENNYRTIFENTGTISFIMNKDNRILMVNKEFEVFSGYHKEEVENQRLIYDFVSEDQIGTLKRYFRLRSKKNHDSLGKYELKFLTRSKEIKYVLNTIADIPYTDNIIVSMIDISELKNAEHSLYQEKERLSVMLRSIGDGVIATDIQGKVILLNKIAEELTGWEQEEAFGLEIETVFNLITQKNRLKFQNILDKAISNGRKFDYSNRAILISKTGEEKIIEESATPLRDNKSNLIGIIIVFRDITEKENMEKELQKTAKLESIGVLAGGIAHDFNNILTAILGNITLCKIYAAQREPKIESKLNEAEKATLRAKDITQQLLTFSKGGAPIRKTTLIKEAVIDATTFGIHGSTVTCEFFLPDNLPPVEADLGQISQVINNLVINSVQAMPNGGKIVVSAEVLMVDQSIVQGKRVSVDKIQKGNYVRVTVEDNGIGMSKEMLDKVFEPFYTTKKTGSGLGLASCYSIIKKHDGFILVDSVLGKGTAFSIYLPTTEKIIQTTVTEKIDSITGSGYVILMDDDEVLINVAKEMLRELGYICIETRDGEEAITVYNDMMEKNKEVKAIIIDLTIPAGLGGKETIEKLRLINPKINAIVSSGYSSDPIMANFKKFGFKGVLPKPYTTEELGIALKKVVDT